MQMTKKNIRKINFKKAVAQKSRVYDQKLEALINFTVSKAFEKVIQAKFLTEIKKLLLTHIPTVVANYVKPRLKTSVLECMTRSSDKELFTPFKDPEREFQSSMKHFKTLSLNESRSPDFDLFSDQEEYSEEEVAETIAETMKQYMSKTRADYG
ncbi:hypothetical protein Tco_0066094 [Tanacetum coccineum]